MSTKAEGASQRVPVVARADTQNLVHHGRDYQGTCVSRLGREAPLESVAQVGGSKEGFKVARSMTIAAPLEDYAAAEPPPPLGRSGQVDRGEIERTGSREESGQEKSAFRPGQNSTCAPRHWPQFFLFQGSNFHGVNLFLPVPPPRAIARSALQILSATAQP